MATGAQALLQTLVDAGVTVCFTNPGTSEMHFVAALDEVPNMRAVLTLFEGVATGAADGYARMTGTPAATLLHLGPGLGNGLANLHNARRAGSPLVNIVGDHATYHQRYDAQLQSDIETVARNVSPHWVRRAASSASVAKDTAETVAAASGSPREVATLIVPADVSWEEGATVGQPLPPRMGAVAPRTTVRQVANALAAGKRTAILLGGRALHGSGLRLAGQIASATGVRLLAEVFPARIERGAGAPAVERLAYFAEMAQVQLADVENLVLINAAPPVSFFAYPGKQSYLVPDGCTTIEFINPHDDLLGSLEALVNTIVAFTAGPKVAPLDPPKRVRGKLTAEAVCQTIAAMIPERAIVSDEANTSGASFAAASATSPRHDVLTLAGGAIGQGLPVAVGAAVACPDRPVIALEADGSAMYTLQSLWTMAREQLDITVVIFNNSAYGILNVELQRVQANTDSPAAHSQLDLGNPGLDFVALAEGMGVPASRPKNMKEFAREFSDALATPGPHLIEARVPQVFTGRKLKALPKVLRAMEKLPTPLARKIKNKIAP